MLFGGSLSLLLVGMVTMLQRQTPAALMGRADAALNFLLTVPQTLAIALGAGLVVLVDYRLLMAGMAALFCTFLRGDNDHAQTLDACLRRHELPRTPSDLGLSSEQFVDAVVHAPSTRPDRYTILEHLALDRADVAKRLDEFLAAYDR